MFCKTIVLALAAEKPKPLGSRMVLAKLGNNVPGTKCHACA